LEGMQHNNNLQRKFLKNIAGWITYKDRLISFGFRR
jgi:hypothetical protein